MTPFHPPEMAATLLYDPFWVAPSEVARMTDREMWDIIRRELKRQERQRERESGFVSHEGRAPAAPKDPGADVWDEGGRAVTPEAVLTLLANAGLARRDQVEETIRRKREAEAAREGG